MSETCECNGGQSCDCPDCDHRDCIYRPDRMEGHPMSPYVKALEYARTVRGMTDSQAHEFATRYDRYVTVVAEENMVSRQQRTPLEPDALWKNWNA